MKPSVYKRPNSAIWAPRRAPVAVPDVQKITAEPIMVDARSECHITPPDVARRMAQYLGAPGSVLEPSAGTGSLARAALELGHRVHCVEVNYKLCEILRGIEGVNVSHADFLDVELQPFNYVLVNPPFSKVKAHVSKCLQLAPVCVALVPITYSYPNMETLETLGQDTFSTVKVNTKIIRIETY